MEEAEDKRRDVAEARRAKCPASDYRATVDGATPGLKLIAILGAHLCSGMLT